MSDQNIALDRYHSILDASRIQAALRAAGPQPDDLCTVVVKEISPTGAVLLLATLPQIEGDCRCQFVPDRFCRTSQDSIAAIKRWRPRSQASARAVR